MHFCSLGNKIGSQGVKRILDIIIVWSINRYIVHLWYYNFIAGGGELGEKVSIGADENEKEVEKHCFRDPAGI